MQEFFIKPTASHFVELAATQNENHMRTTVLDNGRSTIAIMRGNKHDVIFADNTMHIVLAGLSRTPVNLANTRDAGILKGVSSGLKPSKYIQTLTTSMNIAGSIMPTSNGTLKFFLSNTHYASQMSVIQGSANKWAIPEPEIILPSQLLNEHVMSELLYTANSPTDANHLSDIGLIYEYAGNIAFAYQDQLAHHGRAIRLPKRDPFTFNADSVVAAHISNGPIPVRPGSPLNYRLYFPQERITSDVLNILSQVSQIPRLQVRQ